MAQKKENNENDKKLEEFKASLKRLEKLGFQVAYYGYKNKKNKKGVAA